MKHVIAAVILAGLAGTAFAQGSPRDPLQTVVPQGEPCPAHTDKLVDSYTFENGRFVRDGKLCKSPFQKG